MKTERGIEKKRPKKKKTATGGSAPLASSTTQASRDGAVASRTSSTTRAHLTTTQFSSLPLCGQLRRALDEVLGFAEMTVVQQQTLPLALKGGDLIAKARTGTGKTLAFLLPTIERLVASEAPSGRILALAISPTRELASQIAEECGALLSFLPQLRCHVVVGGKKVDADLRVLFGTTPQILVATPGRLIDLLQNHGATKICGDLRTLIFDEADQL